MVDPPLQISGPARAQLAGWLFKLKLAAPSELDSPMDEAAYKAVIAEQH
jgi:glycine cleavage system H lipoate-binding protein